MTHILIVEDNALFRETLKRILKQRFPSITVAEASDGKEAFMEINTAVPVLIFMDIRLPGDNGIQLTRRIQAAYPETSVVIVSNCDTVEYREAALEAGAKAFVSKASSTPVDIIETVTTVFPIFPD